MGAAGLNVPDAGIPMRRGDESVSTTVPRVTAFMRARIRRALHDRVRYRYVQPQVLAEGAGWKVVSPCCSRRIDAQGGIIDIAWFEPRADGGWRLHAREHARNRWREVTQADDITPLLVRLCSDPLREFWQ